MSLAWGKGYRQMIIEKGGRCNQCLHHILEGILEIRKDEIEVKWCKISRDNDINVVADRLALESHLIRDRDVIFQIVLNFFVHLFSVDARGSAGPSLS